ncbi:MAG: 50S ribosomal protein L10 [Bacteroidia bacterium]|jgi:large subunit ribosomal protein L10|nr:50S ribosomal protein L10 [Bacteroidales bacterium]NCD40998.1 50S ribosomal protein L10 [Bacteroidia bacterium]MDD2322676.1 50S ribosomal protein L10 [Bacteroidales bacterium]MDD3011733.1 50S ribosomal protein L10 [Bacteroidales bacterium]MDD3961047.1 50S ribosomal protein L10 [Bacteroidales bacterium]
MNRDEKQQHIDSLAEQLEANSYIYLTDTSELNAQTESNLRRMCNKKNVKLQVVKNTLLKKAMEKSQKDFSGIYPVLKGQTAMMFGEAGNSPAKLIKEFRKEGNTKPLLKGAYVEEMVYLGEENLETLVNIKSKNELLADVIFLLQSPARNLIGALQSGGQILSGVLKTLGEKE